MASLTVQSRIGAIFFTAAVLVSGCEVSHDAGGFEARVYEVQLHPGQSGKLDVANLNADMARGKDLGELLAKIGSARLIYRVCQPMGYNCDSNIAFRTRIPMVTNTRTSATGRKFNTVRYEMVGPDFKVYTLRPPSRADGEVLVRMNADISFPSSSGVEITSGLGASTIREISLNCSNLAKAGEPFVAASMDSNTAYVCSVSMAPGSLEGDVSTAAAPTTRPASGPSTADFQAAIYRLKIPAGQVGNIDVAALSASPDIQGLEAQFKKLGRAKLLYQVSQPVSLTSDNLIRIQDSKPFITRSRITPSGERINSVQHKQVGAIFGLTADPIADPAARSLRVRLNTELSELMEGTLEISKGLPAPIVVHGQFVYVGNLDVGRPFVGACIDASSGGKDGQAVAYIYRVVLSNLR